MGSTRTQEIWVGIFVALGLVALFGLATRVSNFSSYGGNENYQVVAYFNNIGGLKARAPVTMSGVKIGRVAAIEFDRESLQAKVSLDLDTRHDYLSTDTQASIYTSGLLGEQYVSLEVGAEEEFLKDGDTIYHAQSAVVLEELIGRFMTSMTSK